MSVRFATNLLVLIAGGFVAVSTQAFDAATTGWIAFGVAVSILAVTAAAQRDRTRGIEQTALDAIIGLLAVWTVVASTVFGGATLTCLSLGEALCFAGLAAVGLVANEASAEHAVHRLATVERGGEPAVRATPSHSAAA